MPDAQMRFAVAVHCRMHSVMPTGAWSGMATASEFTSLFWSPGGVDFRCAISFFTPAPRI
jgi:hypothetical protein